MPEYRYVGTVAREVQVGDKSVPLAPGDFITLSKDEFKQATEAELQFIEAASKTEGSEK
jgi:hypothetical protein